MHINEPDFWLVFESEGGLEAVASTDLSADDADDRFVAGVAHGFHEAHQGRRLIFMSELGRWLASAGLEWSSLDIDPKLGERHSAVLSFGPDPTTAERIVAEMGRVQGVPPCLHDR